MPRTHPSGSSNSPTSTHPSPWAGNKDALQHLFPGAALQPGGAPAGFDAKPPPASVDDEDQDGSQEGDAAKYVDTVFQDYAAECHGEEDGLFGEGLARVRQHLSSTQSAAAVCLICLETMGRADAVWHCGRACYAVFHLVCIQAWARQQLATKVERAEARLNPERFPVAAKEARTHAVWGCPKCRAEYPAGETPAEYRCFCGKQVNPEFNPWHVPHSCGEPCGRQLPGACGHRCVLLCHPGPCPPCPRLVEAKCYCSKVTAQKRCGNHEFTCGKLCGARLPCGHRCPQRCHPGACPPCGLTGSHACACGAEKHTLPCSQREFHCSRVCGRPLACGRHTCQRVCHAGECGGCALEGPRSCPCGKVTYSDLACDELAAPCGGTCDKLLPCGAHRCQERCHTGPCSANCRGTVVRSCTCGRMQQAVPCTEHLRCQRKCTNVRNCGRHQCKKRCCDGNCPPCDEVCGRRLRCGNHRCPATCHAGACLPCPLTSTVSCACGKTSYTLPCGSEARAAVPRCSQPCLVPRTCRHAAALPPHRCHFGPCPPCTLWCGAQQPCGHTCGSAACHDPPPPPVPAFQQPAPPSSATFDAVHKSAGGASVDDLPLAVQVALTVRDRWDVPCPPCQVAVTVRCYGGHTQRSMPCSAAAEFCCGAACGQPLLCGNHTCSKVCHVVPVLRPGSAAGLPRSSREHPGAASASVAPISAGAGAVSLQPCAQCQLHCQRARPCGHACPRPCHADACPPCDQEVTQPCHCGRSSVAVMCRLAAQPSALADLLCCGKPCHRPLPGCPHLCAARCHAGACPGGGGGGAACGEEVTVRCACRRLKAKLPCADVRRLLAEQCGNPDYDALTPLRLLPCNAECEQLRSKRQKGSLPTSPAEAPQPARTAPAAAPAGRQPGLPVGGSWLSWLSRRQAGGQPGRAASRAAPLEDVPAAAGPVGAGTAEDAAGRKAAKRRNAEQRKREMEARAELERRWRFWFAAKALLKAAWSSKLTHWVVVFAVAFVLVFFVFSRAVVEPVQA